MTDKTKTNTCPDEEPAWEDANVPDVTVDGIPLDGHYLDNLINSIPD